MTETKTPYQPISCSFHDYLDHFATLRKTISITYLENNRIITLDNQIIRDFSGGRKGEYIHLDLDGREKLIRADYLITVDGIPLADFSSDNCSN